MENTQQKVSPQERIALFNQYTRKNKQELGKKTGAENTQIAFDIPRARLMSNNILVVEATLTATHSAATTYTPAADYPWKFIKNVELQLNNGYSPFKMSGLDLQKYNMSISGVDVMNTATSGRGNVVQGLTASSGGTANKVRITAHLPNMLNERDPIGLILTQDPTVLATVLVNLASETELAPASSGYTFAVSAITVAVMEDTFTVPPYDFAFPDISALKVVQSSSYTMVAGENVIKLPTGMTYRKIGFTIYNSSAVRLADANITSTIDMVFNQADVPIRINPNTLAGINAKEYRGALPDGSYILDFSDNGLPNYGGARDYVSSEELTELWLRFTSDTAGSVVVWYEQLTKMASFS